jgi:cytochrome P450
MAAWFRLLGFAIFDGLFFFSMRRPRLLRAVFGLLRRWRPVFAPLGAFFAGATIVVTRADDARDVLERRDDFLLGPVNERKILAGDFIIALDPEHRYRTEKGYIRRALPANRVSQFERIVDRAAARLLAPTLPNPFNAAEFSERITVAIVEEFWGLPAAAARSAVVRADPGVETMRLWLRKLAIVLGSREPAPFGIREVGEQCNEEFTAYVRAECARRTQAAPGNDMIGHILRESGWDLEVTSRNIAALVMTGSAVVTKAFCHAFDQLLRHREARDAALLAAQAGDRERLGRLLVEALRFNPVFPVLPRYCPRRTTIAAGTPRETEVPAGANVIVVAIGAMFDPEAVEEPDRFGYARDLQLNPLVAADDWRYGSRPNDTLGSYMLFGGGEHWCLGDQLAMAEMAAMASALLTRLPGARPLGNVRYDGSAAASLQIGYD